MYYLVCVCVCEREFCVWFSIFTHIIRITVVLCGRKINNLQHKKKEGKSDVSNFPEKHTLNTHICYLCNFGFYHNSDVKLFCCQNTIFITTFTSKNHIFLFLTPLKGAKLPLAFRYAPFPLYFTLSTYIPFPSFRFPSLSLSFPLLSTPRSRLLTLNPLPPHVSPPDVTVIIHTNLALGEGREGKGGKGREGREGRGGEVIKASREALMGVSKGGVRSLLRVT